MAKSLTGNKIMSYCNSIVRDMVFVDFRNLMRSKIPSKKFYHSTDKNILAKGIDQEEAQKFIKMLDERIQQSKDFQTIANSEYEHRVRLEFIVVIGLIEAFFKS